MGSQRGIQAKSADAGLEQSTGPIARPRVPAHAPGDRILQLQQTIGNQAAQRLLQAKLHISQPGGPLEREADRIADRVGASVSPTDVQRTCAGCPGGAPCAACEERESTVVRRSVDGPVQSTEGARPDRALLDLGPGEPLDPTTRAFMEPRFGYDFSQVRVHVDAKAAESARAVNALAYTLDRDVVFGSGQYAPGTRAGLHLLAHELVHAVQQAEAPMGAASPMLQRQAAPAGRYQVTPSLPMFSIPGTGLTLIPGPLRPSILGPRIPLQASLRITNALGTGPGHSFVVDLGPRMLMAHLLQNIDLYTWTRPGAPPGAELDPASQARISLVNPTIIFDPETRRLHGRAVLSVGSDYPEALKAPTEVDVEITSSELGQFSGTLGYGPLHADFTVRLHYDTERLERALSPAFTPAGGFAGLWSRFRAVLQATVPGGNFDTVSDGLQSLLLSVSRGTMDVAQFVAGTIALIVGSLPVGFDVDTLRTALTQFASEITHPGFTVSGGLRLGPLPLSRFGVTAPTTVPLARPLLGAPTTFPSRYGAYGAIIAPAGSISEIAVPAFGATYSSFDERRGLSGTVAALPTLSPAAISAGAPFVREFPVYAYAEGSYVRRISSDLDLGFRVTVQVSTPELFGGRESAPSDVGERLRQMLTQYQEASQPGGSPRAVVPNVGLAIFGRFGGL